MKGAKFRLRDKNMVYNENDTERRLRRMDEMRINSKFTRAIVSTLLKKVVKKKFGYDANIILNELAITIDDGNAHAHVSADVDLGKEDFVKILQNVGL